MRNQNNNHGKRMELYLNTPEEVDKKKKLEYFDPNIEVKSLEVLNSYEEKPLEYNTRPFRPSDGFINDIQNIHTRTNSKSKYNLQKLICVTVFREDINEVLATLNGIYKNLPHFIDAQISQEEIAVCVMFDGILEIHSTCVEFFRRLDEKTSAIGNNDDLRVSNRIDAIKQKKEEFIQKETTDEDERKEMRTALAKGIPTSIPKKTSIVYQVKLGAQDFDQIEHQNSCSNCFTAWRNNTVSNNKLNVFFCAKMLNGGKLSSHLWFFEGFCKTLNPKFICLIDCGTVPEHDGIFNFYQVLKYDSQIGGVCGYMGCRVPWKIPFLTDAYIKIKKMMKNQPNRNPIERNSENKNLFFEKNTNQQRTNCLFLILKFFICPFAFLFWILWRGIYLIISKFIMIYMDLMEQFFSIENAQIFEYSFAHILDKAFESMFGFIAVLPGAWSAYRWKALKKDELLEKDYLMTVLDPDYSFKTVKEANKILAEDRLLCLAIFTKKNNNYILKYAPSAEARTDVITTIHDMLSQRKRWINGTWYAMEHVLNFMNKVRFSSHTNRQQVLFKLSQIITKFGMLTTFILIGLYFASIHITIFTLFGKYSLWENSILKESENIDFKMQSLAGLIIFIYIVLVFCLIMLSLNYKSNQAANKFRFICHLLSLYMVLSLGGILWILIATFLDDSKDYFAQANQILILLYINIGCYVGVIITNPCSIISILRGSFAYIYYLPSYVHSFLIYAFCRIDDLSWGTKGLDSADDNQKTAEFKQYKIDFISIWIVCNALVGFGIIYLNTLRAYDNYIYLALAYYATAYMSIRTVLAIIYQIKFNFIDRIGIWNRMRKFKKKRFQNNIVITSENLLSLSVNGNSMRPLEIRT